MKYNELQYERIDVEKRRNSMNKYLEKFSNAESVEDQINTILDVNDRIKEELRDAKADLKRGVRFIHGFNGGTAIRDWMRGDSLKQFMQSAKISGTIWFTQEGVTCISLDMINLGRDEN